MCVIPVRRSSAISLAGLALSVALFAAACDAGNATCGAAPEEPIVGFAVTTTTGDDGTDADIYFCVTRRSTGSDECELLDELLADDFEPNEINSFQWNLDATIAPSDLEGFYLRNDGGGFLGNNNWDLVGLHVEALLADGGAVMLYDEEMAEELNTGDTYDSSQCTY